MRVISGKYKGRNIKGFGIDGTRPTMDRVKESVFSMIQDYIDEAVVLDLFAGSGNLGIEALSNGASKCYFVDNNKVAIDIINDNIKSIKVDNAFVIKDDYKNALDKFKNDNIKFDLIFLDPPYKDDYIDSIIEYMINKEMLNNSALIICEFENSINMNYDSLDVFKERKYGYKNVVVFKNK